jgi:hypothetical protein
MTFFTEIEREDTIKLKIEYDVNPASRGARDSLCGIRGAGPPLEPDTEASIEITDVTQEGTGAVVELTDNEREAIERDIWATQVNEDEVDYPEFFD